MSKLLDKFAVADRIGVQPKTAAVLMMQMHPVAISGNVRKRYRVTEENLEQWIAKRMLGKSTNGTVRTGKRRFERR